VHYVRWELSPEQVDAFAAGPVSVMLDHPNLSVSTELGPETAAELLHDLRDGG
jgi:hypothetical protein